jgi:hypothetical protein
VDTSQAGATGSDGDPGWRPALKASLWTLIPGLGLVRARSQRGAGDPDGLVQLRSILVSFASSLVLIGIVVAFLAGGDTRSSMSGEAGAALVVAAGTVALLLVRFVPRPLDCSSDVTLAASYVTRFFLRLGFSEAAGLVGFVGFFLTANPAMYPLGLAFTAVGFAWLAPTAAHLEADQEDLHAAGCSRSLVAAVRAGRHTGRLGRRSGRS